MSEEKSIFQKIGDAVADYAPGIATILAATGVGAPAAAAVGAVGALGRAFGLGSAAKPEDILAAISTDPEIRLKSMVADNDFKVKMREADIDELKSQIADIQNARGTEIERMKITGKPDYSLLAFAWLNVLSYFGVLIGFIWLLYNRTNLALDDSVSAIIYMLIGALVSNYTQVNSYFFGSSQGAAQLRTSMVNWMKK
jgi:hypothetical protein